MHERGITLESSLFALSVTNSEMVQEITLVVAANCLGHDDQ